jgi:hypothetical protein
MNATAKKEQIEDGILDFWQILDFYQFEVACVLSTTVVSGAEYKEPNSKCSYSSHSPTNFCRGGK